MQTQNRLLDDVARLFSGAVGMASGVRGEVEAQFRQQFEKILAQMDLVTREEYEVTRDMAAKARDAQEQLLERVAKLEAALAAVQPKAPAAKRAAKSAGNPAAKPRAKASTAKASTAKASTTKASPAKASPAPGGGADDKTAS
jgi:BMFP domain-containing protein YqiC|tara:strand:+ start:2341 stop:2769 length:429 start_codon:yes stop_codon:yes gene_type:complete